MGYTMKTIYKWLNVTLNWIYLNLHGLFSPFYVFNRTKWLLMQHITININIVFFPFMDEYMKGQQQHCFQHLRRIFVFCISHEYWIQVITFAIINYILRKKNANILSEYFFGDGVKIAKKMNGIPNENLPLYTFNELLFLFILFHFLSFSN